MFISANHVFSIYCRSSASVTQLFYDYNFNVLIIYCRSSASETVFYDDNFNVLISYCRRSAMIILIYLLVIVEVPMK